ncbi:hypothetical protein [Calothrix sp. PCC 7507]|uniref:hypothetical protein n=1 Tax=Calothrix sp. PCC 7507 TaxID=99598 RepID=UPI00029ED806|nr:hypothetical protein [Calothrix sp. PCC 7507]AFY33885.1 hypothetical protein Cal7507_3490 [Calothrix sp. PCC 7507]
MFRKLRKGKQYRRQGKNLIATNKIKPEQWHISDTEAKEALQGQGYGVKQIKKINCLKHQVCISFWDHKGNVCSSFFSYRIFARWQKEVEKLVDGCHTLKELIKLNYIMQYEFACYHYSYNVEEILQVALENRLCVLDTTIPQAVLSVI